jgi:hypothetical protein
VKIVEFTAVTVVLSSLLVLACTPEPSDPGPSAEESGGATTEPADSSGTASGTASETQDPSTGGSTGMGTGTTGEPLPTSCAEATTPEQCSAVSDEYSTCGWFETVLAEYVDGSIPCQAVGTTGVCLTVDQLDGCDETFPEDACGPDSGGIFVRTLDDGTIEILPDPMSCGGPGDFEQCPWFETQDPVDEPLLSACVCACDL